MKYSRIVTLFYIVVFLFNSSFVDAKSEPPLVFVIPELPPLGCEVQAGKAPCLHNRLVEKIAFHSNLAIEAEIAPFPRIVRAMNEGTADLILMPEHHIITRNMDPIALSHVSEIRLMTNNVDLFLEKQKNKRIPLLRGLEKAEFENYLGEYIKVPVLNLNQMFGMFAKNRIDAIIGSKHYLLGGLERFDIDLNDIYEPAPPIIVNVWLYCNKGKCDSTKKRLLRDAVNAYSPEDIANIMFDLGKYIEEPKSE